MLKNHIKANFSYIFMFFLISLQVFMINRYSLDIPYFDEWELFRPDSFLLDPSFESLVAQHNEHRLVLPNLIFSFYYHALNFHFPTTLQLNFAVFTLLFLLFLKFSSNLRNKPFIALSALMVFSALNYDNHLWTFQIQWHLFLLFLILSCYFLSLNQSSYRNIIWLIVLPFCMLYSLGSGLAACLCFFLLLPFKIYFQKDSKKNTFLTLTFLISTLIGVCLFLANFQKPAGHPVLYFPYQFAFWDHFISIVSLGLGIRDHTLKFVALGLLGAHIAIAIKVLKRWNNFRNTDHFLFLLATTLLAALASISVSRSGFGAEQGFTSRYFEFSVFYSISIISLIFQSIETSPRYLKRILIFLIAVSALANYDFPKLYNGTLESRTRGMRCIVDSFKSKKQSICIDSYPATVDDLILAAKNANPNLSFLKHFE